MSGVLLTATERLGLIAVKIERAKKHIVDLEREIGAFLATNPYRVIEKIDAKITYEMSHVTPVPGSIVAISGDVIQNLRSALDHLANQLMFVRLGVPTSNRESEFPVRNTSREYKATLRRMVKTGLLRGDAFDALLRIEAYKRGKGHDLWTLNRLNNIDKHRIILTAGSAFRSMNIGAFGSRMLREYAIAEEAARKSRGEAPWPYAAADIPIMDAFFRPGDNMCPLKVGDVLFVNTASDGKMDPEKDFRFDVAFDEPEVVKGKPMLETLKHFADLISNTVLMFRPFLA